MDLLLSLLAKDSASAVFGSFSGAVLGGARALTDMMKAGAEAERVERQLKAVAGELTNTFKNQASVLSKQLAVEDELVMSMQTLMLRYGSAPASIDGATRAVLDYAAATGKDAQSATEALLRGVQNGSGSIKQLGVHFKATGDFGKDMALAVAEVNKKFGGAAAVDAATLAGSARAANQSMGELKETFGLFLGDIVQNSGILQKATDLFRGLNSAMSRPDDKLSRVGALGREKEQLEAIVANKKNYPLTGQVLMAREEGNDYGAQTIEEIEDRLRAVNEELDKIINNPASSVLGLSGAATGKVKQSGGGSVRGAPTNDERKMDELNFQISMAETQERFRAQEHAKDSFDLEQENKTKATFEKQLKESQEFQDEMFAAGDEALRKQGEQQQEMLSKLHVAEKKAWADHSREMQKESDDMVSMWLNAGLRVGTSIIDGILSAMAKSSEEGKDGWAVAAQVAGGVFDMIIGIVGQMIPGFGAAYGALGSVGGAASGGAWSGSFGATAAATAHGGAWVGRYHPGGWPPLLPGEVPIIAQQGERVLSRSEVSAMGGPSGVDGAVRGGGGRAVQLVVQTLDAQSFTQYLGGSGGRGLKTAMRTGRGPLAQIFGVI